MPERLPEFHYEEKPSKSDILRVARDRVVALKMENETLEKEVEVLEMQYQHANGQSRAGGASSSRSPTRVQPPRSPTKSPMKSPAKSPVSALVAAAAALGKDSTTPVSEHTPRMSRSQSPKGKSPKQQSPRSKLHLNNLLA